MSVKIVQLDMLEINHDPVNSASDIVDKIIALDMDRIERQIARESEEKKYNIESALRAVFARDTARQEDVKLLKALNTELYRIVRDLNDRLNRVVASSC